MQTGAQEPQPASVLPTVLVAVAVITTIHLAMLEPVGLLQGRLADPDAYLRSIRVLELRLGGGWFDSVTPALAAPEGLSLHWTRPLDILILLPALALEAVAGFDPRRAIFLAGAVVSPLLHLAAALAAAWGAAAIWGGGRAPVYAVLMMAASPAATNYAAPGRADHHALLLLAVTLGLAAAMRALRPGGGRRAAVMAGAAFGFGVWVGPEALIVAMPVLLAAGLAALVAADGRPAAAQGLAACAGMALVIALAVLVERPPADWLAVEYDRVSVHHLAVAVLSAGVFAAVLPVAAGPLPRRWAVGGATGAAALAALLLAFPGMLGGAAAEGDAVARTLLLPFVDEMQPLPPFGPGDWTKAVFFVGGVPLLGLVALALAAPGWRRDGMWVAGLALAAALLAGLAGTFAALRLGIDLAAPAAIAAAGMMGQVIAAPWPRVAALRAVLAVALLLGALALPRLTLKAATAPAPGAAAAGPGCDATAFARWLAEAHPHLAAPARAPVLMTDEMNATPEIAWRSGLRGVGGTYHRGGAAFLDNLRVYAGTDAGAVRDILRRRQVGLLAICAASPRIGGAPGDMADRLRAGEVPDWLTPLPLPATLAGYRLFAVAPGP